MGAASWLLHGLHTAKPLISMLVYYSSVCMQPRQGKMARMHGHRTDPACSRRMPYLHHLRTVSVRIGNTSRLCSRCQCSQYGLKRRANGASTASIYSRLGPSYAQAYGPFPVSSTVAHACIECLAVIIAYSLG